MSRRYTKKNFPLTQGELAVQETLFHNANGYLGVRGTLEEGLPPSWDTMRGMYINGVYDIVPMKQAENLHNLIEEKETMLNTADTQTLWLDINNERFSLFSGQVLDMERVLDMDAGITERRVHWRSAKGHEVRLCFRRMASFTQLALFTIDCTVTPLNFSGNVRVVSLHQGLVHNYADPSDPRLAAEGGQYLLPQSEHRADGGTFLITSTTKSGLTVCTGVAHSLSHPAASSSVYDKGAHAFTDAFEVALQQGETLRVVKYSVFADSRGCDDCLAKARRELAAAFGNIDALYTAQQHYLADFWQHSELTIHGDDEANESMCFNLYQLLQSSGKDGISSIAAKGLSGEGYEGHYFWDTEMYMMPFFILTNPSLARKLLAYRHTALPAARDNARLLGHSRGALYPWRTIHGKECSGYFPSGTAQYHINGAIAHAVTAYYLATGDIGYLAAEGAELLLETARLWLDTGNWHKGHFIINDVTGPDEYTCIVNNNYYTNACAQYNLRWAVKAIDLLAAAGAAFDFCARFEVTEAELTAFSQAADAMYLPYDEETGINPQDDSFLQKPVWDLKNTPKDHFPLLLHYHPLHLYRHQVCKQADTVLAYFVFDGIAPPEVVERSLAYYEGVTTHDSSLSSCIFSIVSAQLGLQQKAWDYFGDSVKTDLLNTHGNTKDGVHTANMGGSYMAVVNGFAGLRIGESGLRLAPFLPSGWAGYEFRFSYRGSVLKVCVDKTQCTVSLLNGSGVDLVLFDRRLALTPQNATASEPLAKE